MRDKSKEIDKYVSEIRQKYNIELNEENYKQVIIDEIKATKSMLDYFNDYINNNANIVCFEWACIMFLFIKHIERRDVDGLEKYYKLLAMKYPKNYIVESYMADMELEYYGDVFKAKDRYIKALDFKPEDVDSYYNLGNIYSLLGVPEKSIEYYEKAIKNCEQADRPEELKAKALYNVATFYINSFEDKEKATELLEESLQIFPKYERAASALKYLKGGVKWKLN